MLPCGLGCHYPDDYGIEVDAIVQLEQAAANLKRFSEQIDGERSGAPALLAVIGGKGYGYRRTDNAALIPIGALGP